MIFYILNYHITRGDAFLSYVFSHNTYILNHTYQICFHSLSMCKITPPLFSMYVLLYQFFSLLLYCFIFATSIYVKSHMFYNITIPLLFYYLFFLYLLSSSGIKKLSVPYNFHLSEKPYLFAFIKGAPEKVCLINPLSIRISKSFLNVLKSPYSSSASVDVKTISSLLLSFVCGLYLYLLFNITYISKTTLELLKK